jgi:Undecaprenyl-phosphate glucose phosphotransferase
MIMRAFERPKKVGPDADKAKKPESEPRVLAEVAAKLTPARAYSTIVLEGLVRIAEFALIASVGFAMYQIYVASTFGGDIEYMIAVPALSFVAVCVFQFLGLYSLTIFRAPAKTGLKLAGAWCLVFVFALAIAFFLKLDHSFSRVWLAGWFVGGFVLLTGERFLLAWIVRVITLQGKFERRTVLVGGGPAAEPVLAELASHPESDLRILGLFDDRSSDRSPDVVQGYPKLGNVDDLVEFARHTRLDLVIFTLPISAEGRLLEMLRKLWVLPIDIRLAAHTNKLRFRPRSYSYIGRMPVIDVFDKPIADWDVIVKAAFDKIIGGLLLILCAPIMLAVAIAIKLDSPGPILFKQMRHGFNNENIEVYKFRSLYADKSDALAQKLVTKGDARVTRVGRFIRRTSLDELPQLFNVVFKGNLSLVGPRPHVLHARAAEQLYNEVVDGYFARHRVKPGITGWAQINGWRGETDTPEKIQKRVEHDLYYIENWSIFLDAYILLMTPFALIEGKNAY